MHMLLLHKNRRPHTGKNLGCLISTVMFAKITTLTERSRWARLLPSPILSHVREIILRPLSDVSEQMQMGEWREIVWHVNKCEEDGALWDAIECESRAGIGMG